GGDPGCNGAGPGVFTPGWCKGGAAGSPLNDQAIVNPRAIAFSGGHLYVGSQAGRQINRYDAATGAFEGWIGKILASPTGGDLGCNGAGVGTYTPGWCTGGASDTGTEGNGTIQSVSSLVIDGNGRMFANDNYRIKQYVAASGAFVGWIGKINASPT